MLSGLGPAAALPPGGGLDTTRPPGASAAPEGEEAEQLAELRNIDRRVRAHEQAHAAVGGAHAGAPRYEFERGPDGVMYAVAGEVRIDTTPVPNDPQATIEKMDTVIAAALAPMDPSPQDRQVAAEARRERQRAVMEAARQAHADGENGSGRFFDARA